MLRLLVSGWGNLTPPEEVSPINRRLVAWPDGRAGSSGSSGSAGCRDPRNRWKHDVFGSEGT